MKGNVNPFEPWRPAEVRIPQPIHASRPWRPPPPPPARPAAEEPPFVEPVNPLPRNKPPEKAQRRTKQPSAARTPISHGLLLIQLVLLSMLGVFVLLILLNIAKAGWLSDSHAPRLIGLGVSVVLLSAAALNRRHSWYTRLSWIATALAFAGIAAWFVPTAQGVSLWSAYRQVNVLRTLPAGDVAAYQRGAASRRTLIEEFPSFAVDVKAAERAWFRRTVDEAIEKADRQLENDPQTAFADLHRLKAELTQLEHYNSVRKELEAARQRAMQASAKVVQREVKNEKLGRR